MSAPAALCPLLLYCGSALRLCRAGLRRAACRAEEGALRGSDLAHHVVDVLVDRQAEDVALLDLTSLATFTDYFVVATVDNPRQMRAVIDALDEALSHVPDVQAREEGSLDGGWVLFDLGDVVVHIFTLEQRAYYNLEGLWSRAQEVVRIL